MASRIDGKTAKRYARALFEAAPKDTLADLERALHEAANLWRHSADLQEAIANPAIVEKDKAQVVDDFAKLILESSDAFRNLLHVLFENKRLAGLPEVAAAFAEICRAYRNLLRLEVHSARELPEDERAQMADDVKREFGNEVEIRWLVDPELIGGVLIKSGDKTFDNSVKGGLERIKSHLLR